MKIYKFRSLHRHKEPDEKSSFEYTIDIISTGKLWCPKPETLNDLFEISPTINSEFDEKAHFSFIDWSEQTRGWNREQSEQFSAGYYEALNLKKDVKYDNVINEMIANLKSIGVCSFTMNCYIPMIWGVYANNGTGVALEFEIDDDLIGRAFHEVIYSDDRPTIRLRELIDACYIQESTSHIHEKMICTKSTVWQGEEEIRCVVENGNRSARVAGNVKRIILEPKMDGDTKGYLKQQFPQIEMIETKLSNTSYFIELINNE